MICFISFPISSVIELQHKQTERVFLAFSYLATVWDESLALLSSRCFYANCMFPQRGMAWFFRVVLKTGSCVDCNIFDLGCHLVWACIVLSILRALLWIIKDCLVKSFIRWRLIYFLVNFSQLFSWWVKYKRYCSCHIEFLTNIFLL